jgi:iron(III) transport system substrate-binding protein
MGEHRLNRRAFLTAASAGLGAIALAACGQGAAPTSPAAAGGTSSTGSPAASPNAASAGSASAKPAAGGAAAPADWQQQWDGWIAAARKEGKLVLASGPSPDARVKVPEAFKKAFGIDIEYLGGSSSELANRLRSEQGSNQYTVDVTVAGADTAYLTFLGEHMTEPVKPHLINPEVLNPAGWKSGKVWYMDPQEQFVVRASNYASPQVVINTDFEKADGLKSWKDLLKPEYKGKITAFDPTQPGSGGQTGAYLYNTLGADWAKSFYVDQQPGLTLDTRQLSDWVARGKYPISVGIRVEDLLKLQKDGFKIQVSEPWPEAPGYTSAGFGIVGLFKNPPHPNAAKLFLNWILMKDGQIAWNSSQKTVSVRTDVDNSWAPEFIIPKPGLNYFDTYGWDYTTTGWKKINGELKTMLAGRSAA